MRLLHHLVPAFVFVGYLASLGAKADVVSNSSVPDNTLSPDKRFGVTVPPAEVDGDFEENNLVEVKSKRVLGPINISTVYERMNNSELLPSWWSADDSYLLWQVNGKWGMDTQMLVRLKDGEIQWELDVIKELQRAILTRTEALDPKKFLAAKKANWGDGSAYPEKFTFDSKARDSSKGLLTFPVRFDVYLTSNPKGVESVPEIDSYMEATLSHDGEIKVTGFHSGKSSSSPWNEIQAADHQR